VQRKIDSDGVTSEDTKKLRTAEAGTDDDEDEWSDVMGQSEHGNGTAGGPEAATADTEADEVVSECSDQMGHSQHSSSTAADGSSQLKTSDIEDANGMSVNDVVVTDSTAVASVSSDNIAAADNLSAGTVEHIDTRSVTDVIDVDAIDTDAEAGCDKDKSKPVNYDNPLELGLDEYYLEPASDDRPADNVIDVDDEATEAADGLVRLSDTATSAGHVSLASDVEIEVSQEHVEESSCGTKTSTFGKDCETFASELIDDDKPDEDRAIGTDGEVQGVELVVSSAGEVNEASEDNNRLAEDRSDDDAVGVTDAKGHNSVLELASFTEHLDVQRLNAADVGETAEEVSDRVVADQEKTVGVLQSVTAAAGNDTGSTRVAVKPEMDALSVPQTSPTENLSSLCDTDEIVAKPTEHECLEVDERMVESVETSESETPQALNEDSALQQKTELSADDKDVTDKASSDAAADTAQLTEMTDETVADAENVNQSAESVCDYDSMKESAEEVNCGAVSAETVEQHPEEVKNIVTEVVASGTEMQQSATDVEQPTEMTEKVDISPSKDVSDVIAPDETKKLGVFNEDILPSKDMTDMAVNNCTEVMEKATDDEDSVSQHKEVKDMAVIEMAESADENMSHLNEMKDVALTGMAENVVTTDVSHVNEMTDMAVTDNTEVVENVVTVDDGMPHVKEVKDVAVTEVAENVSHVKEMTDVAVTDNTEVAENVVTVDDDKSHVKEVKNMAIIDDNDEKMQTDVIDKMQKDGKNDGTQCSKLMDTDVSKKESITVVTEPVDMSVMLASGVAIVNEVIHKAEIGAEDMELIQSDSHTEQTMDTGCGNISGTDSSSSEVEPTADKKCTVSEIIALTSVSDGSRDRKAEEQEDETEMEIEPLTSSDDAAQ